MLPSHDGIGSLIEAYQLLNEEGNLCRANELCGVTSSSDPILGVLAEPDVRVERT